mmetsp:Transcript_2542/g.4618  ORF Transcript_2542/g.4618 Transcript_2542/m.4618 type:complete len:115 (+) Transcript_2542:58-402(+)
MQEEHEVPFTHKDIVRSNKELKKRRNVLQDELNTLQHWRDQLKEQLKRKNYTDNKAREALEVAIKVKGNEIDSLKKDINKVDAQFEANRIVRNDLDADENYDYDYYYIECSESS